MTPLKAFLGQDLMASLSRLSDATMMGPWAGRRPVDRRRATRFVPVLYGEDHAHGHAELCLLIEGRCRFSFEHEGAMLEAGDLVICPAGVPHAESYVTKRTGYRLGWWSLEQSDPTLHVTRYTAAEGFCLEHRMSLQALPAEVRRRLDRLRAMAAQSEVADVDALREAMFTVGLALLRRALDGGVDKMDTRAALVQQAMVFVQENAGRPLSLDEVARAVHVSPNYLTTLFRSVVGKSLGRTILAERMARAEQLLGEGKMSVKAVAAELGFTDAFAFSRAFKSYSGQSPTRWLALKAV